MSYVVTDTGTTSEQIPPPRAVIGRYYVNAYHNRVEQIRALNADGVETDEAKEWDASEFIGQPDPFKDAHAGKWIGVIRIKDAVIHLQGRKVISITMDGAGEQAVPSEWPAATSTTDIQDEPEQQTFIDRRVVWKAHPFTGGETRWVKASYDTCAGVTIGWRCPDAGRPEGWYPVDTEPVTWIDDPDPQKTPCRRRCWLRVTKGGRVVGIAIPQSQIYNKSKV